MKEKNPHAVALGALGGNQRKKNNDKAALQEITARGWATRKLREAMRRTSEIAKEQAEEKSSEGG